MTDDGGRQRDMFEGPEHDLEALTRRANGRIVVCECCGGNIKLYRYSLGVAAKILVWMLRHSEVGEWVHVPSAKFSDATMNGGDYAKFQMWGLIEPHPERPPEESGMKSSGMWRLTPFGRSFALNQTTAPSHVFNEVPGGFLCVDDRVKVTIVEALARNFNYYDLMRGL